MKCALRLLPVLLVCHLALAADVPAPLPLGAAAPDFKLPGVDGKTYALRDFDKAPVLCILFTCNHCPTAQLYEERFMKLVSQYTPKGVAFVAINPNDPKSVRLDELGYTDLSDTFDEMKVRAKHRGYNFVYLYDGETEEASKKYGPIATPHAYVFDKDRKLRYTGRIDDSERPQLAKTRDLGDALDAVLAGKEPTVAQTKVFGCSIKWAGKEDTVKRYMEKLAAEPVSVEAIDAAGLKALRKNEPAKAGEPAKLRLINFWATWCGPCITEFPELVEINRMYRHRAFEMITVSANYPDEKNEALALLKKQEASNKNYLFGLNDKYALMDAFDKEWNGGLPFTLLVSPTGEVLYKEQGAIDALELKRAIIKALKEDRFKD